MKSPTRDVRVLSIGQALSTTITSLLTTVSSLVGAVLAPHPALSTVPVTATVAGTLAMIYPASMIMARLGRRSGFMLKAGIGGLGCMFCLAGLAAPSFYFFVLGTLFLGLFNSFSQYYRFAAVDAAPTPDARAAAVATVMLAGVVGGVAGPFLSSHFPSLGLATAYANAFVALLLLCGLLGLSQAFLSAELGKGTPLPSVEQQRVTNLSLLSRPGFLFTSLICAAGFSLMTFTMNAAPLSMHHCGIHIQASSIVLQAHFASMYLPSMFNPVLVRRMGASGLVKMGVFLNLIGCTVAALTVQRFGLYVLELSLFGFGWNFMFNGGTLLLIDTYTEFERPKAQGLNSLLVYSANLVASLAAGVLLTYFSWPLINAICLPILFSCLWLLAKAREHHRSGR